MNVQVWNRRENVGVLTWRGDVLPRKGETLELDGELYQVEHVVWLMNDDVALVLVTKGGNPDTILDALDEARKLQDTT